MSDASPHAAHGADRNGRHQPARLAVALLVALALHAGILPLIAVLLRGGSRPAANESAGREVRYKRLSASAWQKNRHVQSADAATPKPKPPAKPKERVDDEDEPKAGQVVSLPPPVQEEKPTQANHLSEWDQKTDRETRSRNEAQHFENPTAVPQLGRDDLKPQPQQQKEQRAGAAAEASGGPKGQGSAEEGTAGTDAENGGGQAVAQTEVPRQTARAKVTAPPGADATVVPAQGAQEIPGNGTRMHLAFGRTGSEQSGNESSNRVGRSTAGGAGSPGLPGLVELTPTLGQLERIAGMPANDYLPDVETDAATSLNAWRWKHATFFNRIHDAVRHTWEVEQVALTPEYRSMYGDENRMTGVLVTLDRTGTIVDVTVAEPSGAVTLDDEAVRAMRATGPLQNPPTALYHGGVQFSFVFRFNVSFNHASIDFNWHPY